MEVSFGQDHIRFLNYDIPGATVHPTGLVAAAQVRDADGDAWPPEIRTVLGETLFIPRDDRRALERFCDRNRIARKRRPDIWSDLLEPFLDTYVRPEDERATGQRLRQAGLSPREVDAIRRRVAPVMIAYNIDGMLWEWVHLGLLDLLRAVTGPLVDPRLQAALGDPEALYAWAMRIAERCG